MHAADFGWHTVANRENFGQVIEAHKDTQKVQGQFLEYFELCRRAVPKGVDFSVQFRLPAKQ
jgi:hypothetical protein